MIDDFVWPTVAGYRLTSRPGCSTAPRSLSMTYQQPYLQRERIVNIVLPLLPPSSYRHSCWPPVIPRRGGHEKKTDDGDYAHLGHARPDDRRQDGWVAGSHPYPACRLCRRCYIAIKVAAHTSSFSGRGARTFLGIAALFFFLAYSLSPLSWSPSAVPWASFSRASSSPALSASSSCC